MSTVYCLAKNIPSKGEKAFLNCQNNTLYVPAESVDAYKESWTEFKEVKAIGAETGIETPCGNWQTDKLTYNLKGQRMNTLHKGMYVKNGKKYLKR